jgi:glycolate oxidase iron-sulfur subunit
MSPVAPADNVLNASGDQAHARIVALAEQCVKCGLCQPQCPTYRVARHEAESPRGRIALAKGLALGSFDAAATATAAVHLDQCLSCMRCERVCPSQVRYGELIVAARGLLHESKPRRQDVFERLLARPAPLRALLRLANFGMVRKFIQSRIVRSVLRESRLRRAIDELPRLPPQTRIAAVVPQQAASRGRVGLFLGCVAAALDRDVHAGARRLLAALGYEVVEPATPVCCGALSLHAGDVAGAQALAAPTRQAFIDAGVDTVLVSASGCFGALRDMAFAESRVRVREIHEFLDADEGFARLKFRAFAARIAVHTPCTQANVARADAAILSLLRQIPQMEIGALPVEPGCCGAAGDYFLRHAAIADALRGEKLDQVSAAAPEFLVTSNVGCRIFLDNGLRRRGSAIEIVHPVALLARQLDN